MAFVHRSERFNTPNETSSVGPGAYLSHQDYQPQASYAPFSSTSPRETFIPLPSHTTPGPGTYTQQAPIPDLDHWGQPKFSPPFACQISRFPQKKTEPKPGPADYKLEDRWNKPKIGKSETEPYFAKVPMVRTNPSIPSSRQMHTYDENKVPVLQESAEVLHSGNKNDSVGPGQYNVVQGLKKSGTDWHKSKSERNLNRVSTATGPIIGPGYYNKTKVKVEPMYKFKQSAVFLSKSSRKPQKTSNSPGPGSYNNSSAFSKKKLPSSLQNFGSSSSRFVHKFSETLVGPGYYNTNLSKKPQIDAKAPFTSSNSRFHYKNNPNPGPGTYENEDLAVTVQKKNLNLQGAFGSTEKRFDYRQHSSVPGPGQYKPEVNKKKTSAATAVFVSKTQRGEAVKKDEAPPPGAYEVSVGFLAQKPPPAGVHTVGRSEGNVPFASTSERFLNKEGREADRPGPGSYDWELRGSGNKIIVSNEGRFREKKKNVPGPGEYFGEFDDKWNKRTFNVLFGEEQ